MAEFPLITQKTGLASLARSGTTPTWTIARCAKCRDLRGPWFRRGMATVVIVIRPADAITSLTRTAHPSLFKCVFVRDGMEKVGLTIIQPPVVW